MISLRFLQNQMAISVFIAQNLLIVLVGHSFFKLFFSLGSLNFASYFQIKIAGRNRNHQINYVFTESFLFLVQYPLANLDFVIIETELLKQQK